MKNLLMILTSVLFVGCSPNFNKDFSVYRNEKNYKMWITYYGKEKDTIAINWLLSYQILNKTNRGIKFDWIRKRPKYLLQNTLMTTKDSLTLYDKLNKKKSSREILFYCSKMVSANNFPKDFLKNKNVMFSLNESEKNISTIPLEQVQFKKSTFFQNILKEIENDSIAIVFHDTVAGDYFQFKGIVRDRNLKFSR
jgi:hypothetical protein